MTDEELLKEVKESIGITGEFHDNTLRHLISEIKEYLKDGGVKVEIINKDSSVGIITRGVADLWDFGSGRGKLSEYFMQRAIQLSYQEVKNG